MPKLDMTVYLTSVAIIPHPNPKSGRTMFMNAINHEPIKHLKNILQSGITILYRGKDETGRIIIGPKDFHQYINYRLNLETITAEDLWKEILKTYPKELFIDIDKEMAAKQKETASPIKKEEELKDKGQKAMELFFNPYEIEGKKRGKK